MTCHKPTEVITTVLLTEGDNAHWTVDALTRNGIVLLQSCDMNFGIAGTPRQLATMLKGMREALANFITEPTTEVPVHVN